VAKVIAATAAMQPVAKLVRDFGICLLLKKAAPRMRGEGKRHGAEFALLPYTAIGKNPVATNRRKLGMLFQPIYFNELYHILEVDN
jgi:hypothetical protein